MKRNALIIGASPSNQEPLDGVIEDVTAWKNYLKSNTGGAWEDYEIIDIPLNPSLEQVNIALRMMQDSDFGLVSFSGHGDVTVDEYGFPITNLLLNENETITDRQINPRNKWSLISLDCCRKFRNGMLVEAKEEHFSAPNSNLNSQNRRVYRDKFTSELIKCEQGLVRLYAASLTQGAEDENSFSRILLQLAKNNSQQIQGSLSIATLMNDTKEYFNKNYPQQTPRYNGGRRLNHFPFAFNLR